MYSANQDQSILSILSSYPINPIIHTVHQSLQQTSICQSPPINQSINQSINGRSNWNSLATNSPHDVNGASPIRKSFGEGFIGGQMTPNGHVSQSQAGANKVSSWSQHLVQILQGFLEFLIKEEGKRPYKDTNR